MLTKRERKWLENRSNKCLRCLYYSGTETIEGICFWCSDKKEFVPKEYDIAPLYRAAAEFEARVAEKLTLEEPCPLPENADLDDCPYSYFIEDEESAFSCRWCRLKRARIAVEEEMKE